MKKKNRGKILVLFVMLLLLTGCTKNLTDPKGNVVRNEETGQVLPSNIVCAPTDEDNLKLYRENKKALEEKYAKELEDGDISKKEYEKKLKSLTDVDSLVPCDKFSVTTGGYEGIWNTIFIKPLTWVIIKIGDLVKNFGLAIVITTLLIRGIMYPLTFKTAKQSENLKKANPELQKLEKKYANRTDEQAMMQKSTEMMAIYKKYNINPLSGCLFGFIQIPLFFAFYEALYRLPALFEDVFLTFNLATSPMRALSAGHYLYLLLPLLVLVTTYFSFTLNSGAGMSGDQAKQMKIMMMVMMVMIVIMSFSMSSAIIIYWITNSTFTIIQNLIVKRSK